MHTPYFCSLNEAEIHIQSSKHYYYGKFQYSPDVLFKIIQVTLNELVKSSCGLIDAASSTWESAISLEDPSNIFDDLPLKYDTKPY